MPPSLPTPICALILIVISLTTLLLLSTADPAFKDHEGRMLQSTTAGTGTGNGGGGNAAPSIQTLGASSSTQSQNGGNRSRRKKGGHGKMIAEFLNAHNEVRAKHGEPPLRWNHTLESYAQQWAAIRAKDCKLAHAPNNQYGENLFWGKYRHWTPREVVKQWADEVAYYNSKNYQCAEGQQCGHYTQIVWRSSAWVGCAKQICLNGEIFVVCEYFPAGNYLDTPDPFTAKTSYPGEENNIPQTPGPNVTNGPPPTTPTPSVQSTTAAAQGTAKTAPQGTTQTANQQN